MILISIQKRRYVDDDENPLVLIPHISILIKKNNNNNKCNDLILFTSLLFFTDMTIKLVPSRYIEFSRIQNSSNRSFRMKVLTLKMLVFIEKFHLMISEIFSRKI